MADWVAVLSDEPEAVVYWGFECFYVLFGGADLDVAVWAEAEWIFLPSCHLARQGIDLCLEVELGKELNEVFGDFLIRELADFDAGWSRDEDAEHRLLWRIYNHGNWVSTWLLCDEVNPLFLLVPEGFFKGYEEFVCNSITDLMQCFLMRLRQLRLELH